MKTGIFDRGFHAVLALFDRQIGEANHEISQFIASRRASVDLNSDRLGIDAVNGGRISSDKHWTRGRVFGCMFFCRIQKPKHQRGQDW